MSVVRLLLPGLCLVGCAGPPGLVPAAPTALPALVDDCAAAYPRPDYRVVHALTVELAGRLAGAFLGVTGTTAGGGSLRSSLLSLEGLVLVDVESSTDGVVVHRALPPFDEPGFAEGMASDIRLLLRPPGGAPQAVGTYDDGSTGCRWSEAGGGLLDVAADDVGDRWLRRWGPDGGLLREVRFVGPFRDGFAAWAVLRAPAPPGYVLRLELLEVERDGAAAAGP